MEQEKVAIMIPLLQQMPQMLDHETNEQNTDPTNDMNYGRREIICAVSYFQMLCSSGNE